MEGDVVFNFEGALALRGALTLSCADTAQCPVVSCHAAKELLNFLLCTQFAHLV